MDQQNCRFCGTETVFFCSSPILNYLGEYFKCPNCLSVQVTNPFWLEEAHTNAISKLDTGLVARCISAGGIIGTVLALEGVNSSQGVDWAGGTGLLTRLLRDQGFKVYSFDKYADPIHAHGFELNSDEAVAPATFISAIECIEHLENPIEELIRYTATKEYFFFTVDLISEKTPDPSKNEWWYYLPESGQHITFPSAKGLSFLGQSLGFSYYFRIGSMHVLSRKKLRLKTSVLMRFRILRRLMFIMIPIMLTKKYSLTSGDLNNLIDEFRNQN